MPTLQSEPPRGFPDPYECLPALDAIRALPPAGLDALVIRWAENRGLGSVRRADRTSHPATYWAFFGEPPFGLPALIRVHQRKSRLQPHHVEAFLGHLALAGCDHGVLITTGHCAPEALRLSRERKLPRLRLISGPEWVRDLARWRAGVRRAMRAAWVLGPPDPQSTPESCPRW